ncbi:hypothetical protein GH714_003111 [Hevea brasiliensis]|uniref:NEDD8-activating enzyme E1 catalytic subunit n=1 Tax=Hevea brasiliensis TaxID=3981 RepID=A0A6A6KHK9_HEVBR|nr:hypothetical protein GH714_003111 [Hevea brasiliensis]
MQGSGYANLGFKLLVLSLISKQEQEKGRELDNGTLDGAAELLRDGLQEYVRILVVGAGGLGCELLKDLALSGFKNLEVIDMDRIEVSNLNRQFLFRLEDVGKPKAEVAAKRVMERVSDVNIVPHFCRIEDKEIDFYNDFNIIVLGLDSIVARSDINAVACSFLEYDSDDNPREETIKPMVDGGTEGFKGHARVIMLGVTPCFECTIWLFPPQVKFPLCTLAEALELLLIVHSGKTFDPDDPEHMKLSGELSFLAFKELHIHLLRYNGVEGLHVKVTEFVKDKDCLVCGPGVLIHLDTSVTLQKFIDMLEEHHKLFFSKASVTHRGKNLYMQAPPVLEEMTRSNLSLPLFELMGKVPKDIVHVTGIPAKTAVKSRVSENYELFSGEMRRSQAWTWLVGHNFACSTSQFQKDTLLEISFTEGRSWQLQLWLRGYWCIGTGPKDLSKQISLLVMDDDEDPVANYPSVSFQDFSRANYPIAPSPFMYEQRRESKGTGVFQSKGTGVFIPRSSQQRKQRQGRQSSFNSKSHGQQDNTRMASRSHVFTNEIVGEPKHNAVQQQRVEPQVVRLTAEFTPL